ncbi:MAG: hypothetical protein J6K21_04890 [Bacilli bacterium]|nr:hypothetical protein [Bacilli bacterium]
MEEKYREVPNIISGKDLDYLSDMFEWNYGLLKNTNEAVNKVNNEEIKNILIRAMDMFINNINNILGILGGKNE